MVILAEFWMFSRIIVENTCDVAATLARLKR